MPMSMKEPGLRKFMSEALHSIADSVESGEMLIDSVVQSVERSGFGTLVIELRGKLPVRVTGVGGTTTGRHTALLPNTSNTPKRGR